VLSTLFEDEGSAVIHGRGGRKSTLLSINPKGDNARRKVESKDRRKQFQVCGEREGISSGGGGRVEFWSRV